MTDTARIPVVSIVGKSDSGKTTLVETLIRELTERGWRVATVKHHIHEIDIDVPGKDSWRHARAGAVTTMISSPTQFAVVRRVDSERTLDELADAAVGADILLTEGFKRAGSVRIEVSRRGRSDEIISAPEELFALVTDNDDLKIAGVPRFGLDDARGLADLIEADFLQGRGDC
jgi:molybdopterin-guanine dinucleotide biosynthesis adapter protein